MESVKNEFGWETLGIVSSSLLTEAYLDHMSNVYENPQTMTVAVIVVDYDEVQARHQLFIKYPPPAKLYAQRKISEILNKTN